MPKFTLREEGMLRCIRAYALENYNDGWDEVVECFTDDFIVDWLRHSGSRTTIQAKAAMARLIRERNAYANDIINA